MFSDREATALRNQMIKTLEQTMVVYTRAAVGSGSGTFDVTDNVSRVCRLARQQRIGQATLRAEDPATRILRWHPDYVLPARCEVLISGVRWRPRPATFYEEAHGPSQIVVSRECEVTRVTEPS